MPVIDSTVYPSLAEVMDLARAIVNDSFAGSTGTQGEGRILTNDAAFTIPYVNSALRKLQRKLENNNVTSFTVDNFFLQIPAITNPGAAGQLVYLGYTGFFDGTFQFSSPFLPPNLLVPLEVWERPISAVVVQGGNTGAVVPFQPMFQCGVLPSCTPGNTLGYWTWNQDELGIIGANQPIEIRLRHKARILLPAVKGENFDGAIVGCADSADAVAYEIAVMYASAREGGAPPDLKEARDEAVHQMINRYVRMQQAERNERIPYGTEGDLPGGNASTSF
jgi:hypothetical protein